MTPEELARIEAWAFTDEELAKAQVTFASSCLGSGVCIHQRMLATIDARDAEIRSLDESLYAATRRAEVETVRAEAWKYDATHAHLRPSGDKQRAIHAEAERDRFKTLLQRAVTECDQVNEGGEDWHRDALHALTESNGGFHSPGSNESQSPEELDSDNGSNLLTLRGVHKGPSGITVRTYLSFGSRAEAAAWISEASDSMGADVVAKHWTEYGPSYVRRCLGKVPEHLIREAVAVLGWEEDAWGFPSLESVLAEVRNAPGNESS